MGGKRTKAPEDRANKHSTKVVAEPPPRSVSEAPPAPEHLTEAGRAAWAQLWDLGAAGAYAPAADAFIIDRYATQVQRRQELLAVIKAEGYLTEGSQGQQVMHPAARLLREVEADMRKDEKELGLTPVARFTLQGLVLGVEQSKSKLEAFLEGGGK